MAYLIVVGAALVLLGGFVLLTGYERTHAVRFFSLHRARLDARAEHVTFVLTHVDFLAFAREETQRIGHRLGHTIAHLSLQVVRTVERLLTRTVRHLRTRHIEPQGVALETKRPFVKALSEFKDTLKTSAPEPPKFDIS